MIQIKATSQQHKSATATAAPIAHTVRLVLDDGAQALALVHHVDGRVDALHALQLVRDEVLDGQVAGQKLIHQLGNLHRPQLGCLTKCQHTIRFQGMDNTHLSARLESSKGSSLPLSASDQLEGAGGDLVAGGRHTYVSR